MFRPNQLTKISVASIEASIVSIALDPILGFCAEVTGPQAFHQTAANAKSI